MFRRLTPLLAATVLAAPAVAQAAPWTAPAPVPGATAADGGAVFTAAGHGAAVVSGRGIGDNASGLAPIAADGTTGTPVAVPFVAQDIVTYAKDRIVVAGRSRGPSGSIDDSSEVQLAYGSPGTLGHARTLPGTKGEQLYGTAASPRGDVALVTGGVASRKDGRTRTLWLHRAGSTGFAKALTIDVGPLARDAAVAVGPKGDVLVAYEDNHHIYARHVGRHRAGARHLLGDGVQSTLEPLVQGSGRLDVAWKTQRVNEGSTSSPATVRLTTAAPGHGFGPARQIATVPALDGEYVEAPALRLLATADDRALLAYTDDADGHFVTRVRDIDRGHRGTARTLGDSGPLAAAATGPGGRAVVMWRRTKASGAPGGLDGSVRAAGSDAFGAAEEIAPPEAGVFRAWAALDPISGSAVATIATFGQPSQALVSVRPGG